MRPIIAAAALGAGAATAAGVAGHSAGTPTTKDAGLHALTVPALAAGIGVQLPLAKLRLGPAASVAGILAPALAVGGAYELGKAIGKS